MGLKNFFGKLFTGAEKTTPGSDPLKDLTLPNLQPGWLLDYDMKTWQVEAYHYYDWGSGYITHEWQLKSHDETVYLEKESDDEEEWSVNRKLPIGRLGSGITRHIIEHEDPPDQIQFEGTTFYLEDSAGGYFYQNGKGPGQELLKWDYSDKSEKQYLSIEQWGEEEFEASIGIPAEAYQFTNILPGAAS